MLGEANYRKFVASYKPDGMIVGGTDVRGSKPKPDDDSSLSNELWCMICLSYASLHQVLITPSSNVSVSSSFCLLLLR